MTNEFMKKVVRLFISALAFLCVVNIAGMDARLAHQWIFMLGIFCVFSIILKNIWLTLFMWWSAILFLVFKMNLGGVYLQNIFLGCVVYFLVKLCFERKHIDFYLNIILWLVFANLAYGLVQIVGCNFLYRPHEYIHGFLTKELYPSYKYLGCLGGWEYTNGINGFMGFSSCTAILYTFAIPILLTRKNLIAKIGGFLMFVPIYYLHSSTSLMTAIIAVIFLSFFMLKRKYFFIALGIAILSAIGFLMFCDMPGKERFALWKLVLTDCNLHPVIGWGMDSFRNFTAQKQHLFVMGEQEQAALGIIKQLWDNPHNLYISLWYEFGIVSLILLGGYIRQVCLWFKDSEKTRNLLALTTIILIFFVSSIGQFPIFLARMAVIIIPCFALFEVEALKLE